MDKRRPALDVRVGDWILTRDEDMDCAGDPILDVVAAVYRRTKMVETWHGQSIPSDRIEEVRRNTHMVAAAPEMYAALKALEFTPCAECGVLDQISAAIAKAEGR